MDIATIIGLLLGIILIGGSMLFTSLNYGLSMGAFWNLESMMIVLGGTLSATAIAFRLNDVKNVFGLIKFVFQKPSYQLDLVVDDLVNLGEAYRKDRKSLEQAAQGLNNRFLKDGVLFIAQALGIPLDAGQQFIVVITALLASIGAAGIPSAGLVMLFIVTDAVGLQSDAVALWVGSMLAIDRPLDMFRTMVNISSDSVGAAVIAKSEGEKLY